MCAIFGFIRRGHRGPDIACLRQIALANQSRGHHAFGLAWLDGNGTIQTWKAPGRPADHLDQLDRCRQAIIVVGHCRWATHGSPDNNVNNHPHAAGSGWIVHNGVVQNHRELVRRHRLDPQSECDSEILGLLIAKGAGDIARRAAWAAGQAEGDLAILGIWRQPARLLVARRGRPLHFGQAREGFYLASLAEGLPGRVRTVADHGARVLAWNGQIRVAVGVQFTHPNTLKNLELRAELP